MDTQIPSDSLGPLCTPTQDPGHPPADDENEEGCSPTTNWDGLLSAELILRNNNDHKLTDLSLPSGRDRMANFIRNVNFLDAHDAHSIALALDNYVDGALPRVPKMSLVEMEAACSTAKVPHVINGRMESGSTNAEGDAVHYDSVTNRYSIHGSKQSAPPALRLMGDNLKAIFWNSNSWDLSKAHAVADLVTLEDADVIMITDARIDQHRELSAVDSFARTLQRITNKTW